MRKTSLFAVAIFMLNSAAPVRGQGPADVTLPEGVRAVWDLSKAYHEVTPTRERISINGLWRWQPAGESGDAVPSGSWGWFKVPGSWPGIGDYMQKDCQTVFAHPDWKDTRIARVKSAWYQREITVPAGWAGRRIVVGAEYLNSYAAVFVDGKKAGELFFPGGEADVTAACRPGEKHVLGLMVVAMPLNGVMQSYSDSASVKTVAGTVERRGLCGDVWLAGMPAGAKVADVRVETRVSDWSIGFDAGLDGLSADGRYVLLARVSADGKKVKEFASKPFRAADLKDGRFTFTANWKPGRLWDTHTPGNQFDLDLALAGADGVVLDAAHGIRFGFREFLIKGKDYYLNGTRIFCSVVPLDNAAIGAALARYKSAKETFERLKGYGFNAVYTHNYGCEPGSHLGFTEILKAADDTGMLVFFSQPHFGQYDWDAADADRKNGYARHAGYYVRMAQNHPAVVLYAMSHNGAGYAEDMNPDMLGIRDDRDEWSEKNARKLVRAEAIVRRFDPSRIVYHHSGGLIGSMDTVNFYGNFIPIQEMADWMAPWSEKGVKPVFLCEFGVPLTWDMTMYRGWYKGKREFGSGVVPWEYCLAEWNSQYYGDRAFRISEVEKRNLRWEAGQFRDGKLWHRWDYPVPVGDRRIQDSDEVFARYFTRVLRSIRSFGISGYCLWDLGHHWTVKDDVARERIELKVDWDNLQRPGFSPDYVAERFETFETAFDRSDWIPSVSGRAVIRNNGPLLAFVGGGSAVFTAVDHNYLGGESVEKQLLVINNSRETVTCDASWTFGLPSPVAGKARLKVKTGDIAKIPLKFVLPPALASGPYELKASFRFSTGEIQEDSFQVDVEPASSGMPFAPRKIAVYDPGGETMKRLAAFGVAGDQIAAGADLSGYELLVVGKRALTVDGPAPDISRVRDGLKVIVFEQSAAVLEKRFGFRTVEYGLRQVYTRVFGHPLLAGLDDVALADWRGEATLTPPRLEYDLAARRGPRVEWAGIEVPRVWRCGNRGNVASTLIEKPACGDFLPVLDGGYSLQYATLMEYREGKGMVLFCQMDVTGRTVDDPAADRLVRNILAWVPGSRPATVRKPVYAGDPAGRKHLAATGINPENFNGAPLTADQVLIVGPGGGAKLASRKAAVGEWIKAGGRVVAVGLASAEANSFLPFEIGTRNGEHISSFFEPAGPGAVTAGIGPADVHCRDARNLDLVVSGADAVGDGVMARSSGVVFCQLVPWQFDYVRNYGLKRTFRRSAFLLNRLLAAQGAVGATPLLARFSSGADGRETRWLNGFYLDQPEEWDDPYRFFRW